MTLYSIETGFFKLDGGAMFGVVPKSIWNKLNPADDNNLCSWALRCLLIEEGGRLILIDNGIGDKQDAKFMGHYYLYGDDTLDKSLAKHGFHRDDITDVLLTHLHFDHCGGSIVREGGKLVPAFKNAIYWSNQSHWAWATEPNEREKASFLKENILPIQESGQLRFIEPGAISHSAQNPGASLDLIPSGILPELSIRPVNGHTEAMMIPQIDYKGKKVVYMADLLPSVAHLPLPYIMGYDMFPLTTLHEKKAFLQEAVAGDYILLFEHDPVNECCTLQPTEKGVRAKDIFRLEREVVTSNAAKLKIDQRVQRITQIMVVDHIDLHAADADGTLHAHGNMIGIIRHPDRHLLTALENSAFDQQRSEFDGAKFPIGGSHHFFPEVAYIQMIHLSVQEHIEGDLIPWFEMVEIYIAGIKNGA